MSTRVVGVDIGSSAVHVAEVDVKSKDGRSGSLRAFASAELPVGAVRGGIVVDPDVVGAAIRSAMNQAHMKTKVAMVGVGAPSIAVREVSIPEMPLAQARKSLHLYVENVLPMPVDEAVLDFFPSSSETVEGRAMMNGVLVAASRDTVTRVLAATEKAGLELKAIDLSAFAILRSLGSTQVASQVVAFIDIGARVTTVAVYQRGAPKLIRFLEGGTQTIVESIAAAGSMTPADAHRALHADPQTPLAPHVQEEVQRHTNNLLDGIRQTLVYYASTGAAEPVTDIVLTGGGSLVNGLPQALASRARIRVSFGDPLLNVSPTAKGFSIANPAARSLMSTAVGLTLREMP